MTKLLTVPTRCQTKEMLLGAVAKLDNVQDIVVLIDDGEGVWTMMVDGITCERINWMLDRPKINLHEAG